jgi:hypothetical protein
MALIYWNKTSRQFRTLTKGFFHALFPGAANAATLEALLTHADKEEAIAFSQQMFAHLGALLADASSINGTDFVGLDAGTVVASRVRIVPIVRFISAASHWLAAHPQMPVRILPSLHFTDWLLYRLCSTQGRKISLFSGVWAFVARKLLPISDARIYAPRRFKAASAPPPAVPTLLFAATMETHAKNLIPLMQAACAQGIPVGLVTSSASARWPSRKSIPRGVVWLNFRDFITEQDLVSLARDRQTFVARFAKDKIALRSMCVYKGVDFWPLVEAGFKDLYESVFPDNLLYMRIAQHILAGKVEALVGSRVLRASETSFMALARAKGVRTALILHGLITNDPDFYYASGRFDVAQRVYVWNQPQKAHAVRKGAHEIVVDANPQWETIGEVRSDKTEVLRLLGCASQDYKKVITFFAQPRNPPELWRQLARAASRVPATLLIIKAHPAMPPGLLKESVGTLFRNVVLVEGNDANTYALIKNSDLVLTVTSTTFFEALVMGTPVALVRAQSFGFVDELRSYGMPVVQNEEEIGRLFLPSVTKQEHWRACEAFRERYLDKDSLHTSGVNRRILAFLLDSRP